MKPIKTIVAACLAAVALSVGALSLGACGPSAEEVVRQGVADELERLKTHDEALLDELVLEALGSVEPTESNPVELPFARTDNAWGPASGAEQALSTALFSG